MKAQFIILFLSVSVVSTNTYATEKEQKKQEKKTQKSKYDFNIFKLYTITKEVELTDSLKNDIKTKLIFIKED